jgi:hypothetical protein
MTGTLSTNAFHFPHCGLKQLSVFVGGMEKRFEMNMAAHQGCSGVLRGLYKGLGQSDEDSAGNFYTVQRLRSGNFLIAVDLTVDQSGNGESRNLDRHGTVRVQGLLTAPLNYSLCVMVKAFYDSVIEIDSAREVVLQ